ncbi:MAG: CinA family protein [Clostridia bacterium]|nr:CinA family protein [Clostridia bacterium]
METAKTDFRIGKNCLLVFRNRKVNVFDEANSLILSFSECGYYFDKISYISYNNSDEIVRALKDGKRHYENLVLLCPSEMQKTLKRFISSLYLAEFNELGILKNGNDSVFVFTDKECRLRIDDVKNILDNKYGNKREKAYIRTVGAPADVIKNSIDSALNIEGQEDLKRLIDFNIIESFSDCTIEIAYSENIQKSVFDKIYRALLSSLDEYVYALENVPLAERLFQILKLRRMKISVAESFTGGGICKRLVDVPGISEVFYEGLNTYSNGSKHRRLGVKDMTLKQYGAVSQQTASEMAEGLMESGNCDISIATTGIAGPKSDNTQKPVGLIYIAVGTHEHISVYKYNLKGDRNTITQTAINLALFLAFKTLK